MTELFIEVAGAQARATRDGILTSGMVGVQAHFAFDSAWDGLQKEAVFEGSGATVTVLLSGDSCEVPPETLVLVGTKLKIGVIGRDVHGDIVLPSTMALAGRVLLGADSSNDPAVDPTLPVYAQILAMIGDMGSLETEDKETLVDAINSLITNIPDDVVTYIPQTLTEEEKGVARTNIGAASASEMDTRLSAIDQQIADILYKPIAVNRFTNNVGTVEMGSTITAITFTWDLNKTATTLDIDGEAIDPTATSIAKEVSVTANKSWQLKATDERGAEATAHTAVYFYNGVYHGVLPSGADITSAAILTLTRTLRANRSMTFTVNAGATEKICFAIPTRYGTPTFKVGGFEGGLSLAATIAFENASGYTEDYNVYLSDNVGLGTTTVNVT